MSTAPDAIRAAFEAWADRYGYEREDMRHTPTMWTDCWQAACATQAARIAELQDEVQALKERCEFYLAMTRNAQECAAMVIDAARSAGSAP